MADTEPRLGDIGFAGDDRVIPFQVEGLDARGRAVQLGPILDQILGRHDYPDVVASLLAEMIVLTVLLGTSLKFEGKFIVQTQGDGPVELLVVDFRTPDSVRAYAKFDADRLEEAERQGSTRPEDLLGTGILALTIDQGAHMQRYQGIVQLDGTSLEEVARLYFRQSEQIPTEVRLGVAELYERENGGAAQHHWRAGGVVVQFLPDAPERMRQADLPGGDVPEDEQPAPRLEDDAWIEVKSLMETIDTDELTDPQVGAERLLYRLFHERGVRVFEPSPVYDNCSCSREKIKTVLKSFTPEQIEESIEDGKVEVTCEFCSTRYTFDPAELDTGEDTDNGRADED